MLQQVSQKQVKSILSSHNSLEEQMKSIENRTNGKARLTYNKKFQWDSGNKDKIDSDALLDNIVILKNGTVYYSKGIYMSFVLDTGGFDVKFDSLEYTHSKPGNTNIVYYTRSGNTEIPDIYWDAWTQIGQYGEIKSPNARYIQVKIELTTLDYNVSPSVSEFAIIINAGAGVQELYDARGGYRNINERLMQLGHVYQLKVIPSEGQTDFEIGRPVEDGATLKVYLNGQLQTEGTNKEDAYTIVNMNTVRFNLNILSSEDVLVFRIEGAGSGVVTVRESRVVGEIPTTINHKAFTLSRQPIPAKTEVTVEGIQVHQGLDNDYTVIGQDIVFNYTLSSNFTVRVSYYYE